VWNNDIAAAAAAHSVDPDRWWTAFGAVIDRTESRFARCEPLLIVSPEASQVALA
jgi:hypothetical protein